MSSIDPFDDFEPEHLPMLEEEKPLREPGRAADRAYTLLAVLFLAATLGVCVLTVLLVQNPTLPVNPFPPPTPQPTATLFLLGETGESSAGSAPQPTASPTEPLVPTPITEPTRTSTPAPAPTGITPLPGATNTAAAFSFTLQDETYTYTQYAGEEGCDYMAIAGQVFDASGAPLKFIPIHVSDADGFFETIVFSSSAPQYGPSGYEVYINNSPYEAEFSVQLVSDTGRPLSDEIVVRTRDTCEENLVIVNFVQNQAAP